MASPQYSRPTVVTYQEYSDVVGPSPNSKKGGQNRFGPFVIRNVDMHQAKFYDIEYRVF